MPTQSTTSPAPAGLPAFGDMAIYLSVELIHWIFCLGFDAVSITTIVIAPIFRRALHYLFKPTTSNAWCCRATQCCSSSFSRSRHCSPPSPSLSGAAPGDQPRYSHVHAARDLDQARHAARYDMLHDVGITFGRDHHDAHDFCDDTSIILSIRYQYMIVMN